MISAIQTSVAGMMRASERANEAAAAIVRAPVTAGNRPPAATTDTAATAVAAIVALSVAAHSYKADATAVRVADEMLGETIDRLS